MWHRHVAPGRHGRHCHGGVQRGLLMEVQTLSRHGRVMWGVILGAMGTMGRIAPEAMGIIPGAMGIMWGIMPGAMGDNVRSKGDNGGDDTRSTGGQHSGDTWVAAGMARVGAHLTALPTPCPSPVNGKWRQDAANALPINFSFSVGVSKQKGGKKCPVFGDSNVFHPESCQQEQTQGRNLLTGERRGAGSAVMRSIPTALPDSRPGERPCITCSPDARAPPALHPPQQEPQGKHG